MSEGLSVEYLREELAKVLGIPASRISGGIALPQAPPVVSSLTEEDRQLAERLYEEHLENQRAKQLARRQQTNWEQDGF